MINTTNFSNFCQLCKAEYEKWCLLQLEYFDVVSQTIPSHILKLFSPIILWIKDSGFDKICEYCYKEFLNLKELLQVWKTCYEYENNSCRICCSEFDDWNLIQFTKLMETPSFDLLHKLGIIVGDDILQDNSRPEHVCEFCYSSVKKFNDFLQMLRKSCTNFGEKNSKSSLLKLPKHRNSFEEGFETKENYFSVENVNDFVQIKNSLDEIFSCVRCVPAKKFLTLDALNLHSTIHQIRHYSCQYCGRVFATERQRNDHENIHTNDQPYVCDAKDCNKKFHKNFELVNHKKIHNGVFQTCNICGKKNLINLKGHLKLHTQNRYKCPACPRNFLTLLSLEAHSKMHRKPAENERQYKCQYCLSIFKRGDRLKEHINALHLNIKPYICSLCGKKYPTGYQLNTHRKQAHSESSFSCNDCGRTYSLLISLIKHKKVVHEDFKKFMCEICGEGFNIFNKFKNHQDNHNLDDNQKKKIIHETYKKIRKNIYENTT